LTQRKLKPDGKSLRTITLVGKSTEILTLAGKLNLGNSTTLVGIPTQE
jgi:hypothetical protein